MNDSHGEDLFEYAATRDAAGAPLAERMRPTALGDIVGQEHLLGEGKLLRSAIEGDQVPSMILWGPPGTGKTTLARVIAARTRSSFEVLSATASGVRDIRDAVERARRRRAMERRPTVMFIDEIHRFNRSQQDTLLPHVEAGLCRLVGATTENPSFEVNAALLSRTRVFRLERLAAEDLTVVLRRALEDRDRGLGRLGIGVGEPALELMARAADGDARRALSTLEVAVSLVEEGATTLPDAVVKEAIGRPSLRYDKKGEEHYNLASALIKSMRASDADAAVYWLTRMLEAGEDIMFLARRLVIFASEDVGNADPQGLVVAASAAHATHLVGLPEAVLPLTQAAIYLSLAPKSNVVLKAYGAARRDVREHGTLEAPLDIRNAVTPLMKTAGYGAGYRYPHDFVGGVVPGQTSHLPEPLRGRSYVAPGPHGWEAQAWTQLDRLRAGAGPEEDPEPKAG